MRLTILFFGITTDLVGKSSLNYTLEKSATIETLRNWLREDKTNSVYQFGCFGMINSHRTEFTVIPQSTTHNNNAYGHPPSLSQLKSARVKQRSTALLHFVHSDHPNGYPSQKDILHPCKR